MAARRRIALIAALLLAGSRPLEGAFFMRLRGTARQLQALGGQTLYRADAHVNGIPAALHVLGFSSTADDLGDEIRRLWRLPTGTERGPLWIARERRGRAAEHLLILPGPRDTGSTAWLIEPEQALPTAGSSIIPPPPGIDEVPGGAVRFWVANNRSRSLLALYETTAAPVAALNAAADRLTADGWTRLSGTAAFSLFGRDGRAAVAYVSADPATGGTRLALFIQGGNE